MSPDLGAAFAALDSRSRSAIATYAERVPTCFAAAVGAAMARGVRAREVEELVQALPPARRGLLYTDAIRQQQFAQNRGAYRPAAFFGALAALADRKQIPL